VLVEPRTNRLVAVSVSSKELATLIDNGRVLPLSNPVAATAQATPAAAINAALAAAHHDVSTLNHRSVYQGFAWFGGALAVLALLAGVALGIRRRGEPQPAVEPATPTGTLVRS
jgi:hypothetical protein